MLTGREQEEKRKLAHSYKTISLTRSSGEEISHEQKNKR